MSSKTRALKSNVILAQKQPNTAILVFLRADRAGGGSEPNPTLQTFNDADKREGLEEPQ
jgi:hypothetical protein